MNTPDGWTEIESDAYLAEVHTWGMRLDGRRGYAGLLTAKLTRDHIRSQYTHAKNRGDFVRIVSLDGSQAVIDAIASEVA